jgi:hypothetical protein
MKIYLFNDTSGNHCGCDAVIRVLDSYLRKYDVIAKCRTHSREIDEFCFSEADIIIVNGEGTLHDNQDEAQFLMSVLDLAEKRNKRTILVNALFENMSDKYHDIISKIDYISARDPQSKKALEKCGGKNVHLFPDLCFNKMFINETIHDKHLEIAIGDLHPDAKIEERSVFEQLPYQHIALNNTFEDVIARLRNITIYVTGQFHGILAATLVQTRFVPIISNSSKIQNLIHWSALNIPIIKNFKELSHGIDFARHNEKTYRQFNKFLCDLPKFTEKEMESALYGK